MNRTVVGIWRFIIACLAAWSAIYFIDGILSLRTFTVQINLLVAAYFLWLATRQFTSTSNQRRFVGLHGAIVVYALLMSIVYNLFGGTVSIMAWQSLLAHVGVPLLVLLDWLVVEARIATLRWWYPFAWLSYPVAYLVMTLAIGAIVPERYLKYQYIFLNPTRPNFVLLLGLYTLMLIGQGYLIFALNRVMRWHRNSS